MPSKPDWNRDSHGFMPWPRICLVNGCNSLSMGNSRLCYEHAKAPRQVKPRNQVDQSPKTSLVFFGCKDMIRVAVSDDVRLDLMELRELVSEDAKILAWVEAPAILNEGVRTYLEDSKSNHSDSWFSITGEAKRLIDAANSTGVAGIREILREKSIYA